MRDLIAIVWSYSPAVARAILHLVSVLFFLYGFSLLAEAVHILRSTSHAMNPAIAQAVSLAGIGYLLLSALLWVAA